MSDASKSDTPPWRTETWRLTHGPEDDRQTRWFLAVLWENDGVPFWRITEPGTPHFIATAESPAKGVAYLAVNLGMVDPVIEKLEPGSPEDLRSEIDYLRSREAHFASVLKVADAGQYRADWTAPLQRVLDENKALHAEIEALRDGQESVRLALLECLRAATGGPLADTTLSTAAAVKDLRVVIAALHRACEDAREAQVRAERVAAVLAGSADAPMVYYSRTPGVPHFAEHGSAKLAEEEANRALKSWAEEVWDEDVEYIQWGVLTPVQRVAMVGEVYAEDDTTERCDYELRWVKGAGDGEAKAEADAPGVWVVNRPNEKPTAVAVDSHLRATMLDGSDTGWAKYEDRSGWSWERMSDAHAAMLRVGYSVGYEGGARTMRQNVAARLARMSTDCRSRATGSRGGEAAVFLESDADAYAEAERVVQGLDLPMPGSPRGE